MQKKQTAVICFLISIVLVFQCFSSLSFAVTHNFDLQAHGECGFVTLRWDAVPGASSYWIYRGTAKDKIHSMPLTDFPVLDTTYVDSSNIQNEQEYWYVVTAIDDKQSEIGRSAVVSAIPHCEDESNPYNCQLILRYQVGNRIYWVNDDSKGPMNTAPIIMHSRMFLVIRYVTQSIPGISIAWDGTDRKVSIQTLDGGSIELWIGKSEARVNGQTVLIDPNDTRVVPIIQEGRTLLPLRFIVENLETSGVEDLLWDETTRTVAIMVEDPVCNQEGLRYAMAVEKEDGFYEFSVEYHTMEDAMPPVVNLKLFRSEPTKTLRLGKSKQKNKPLDLDAVSTPSGLVKPVETALKKGWKWVFRLAIEPGVLHFYQFCSDTGECLPSNSYKGPIYASLPDTEEIQTLQLNVIKDGETVNLQGYFTAEPYPMLVDDYWSIAERSNTIENSILLRLDGEVIPEEGSFIALKGEKQTLREGVPFVNTKRLLFTKKIIRPLTKVDRISMPSIPTFGFKNYRFSIIYTGCNNGAKVTDSEGVEHVYHRSRADFTGDVLHSYKSSISIGIPKENTFVCFGRGDGEIDEICASDGDGNPFDFEWTDRPYRIAMEQDAERWWRADDDWRLRQGTRNQFIASVDAIRAKIDLLPSDVIPEVYVFICTHGHQYGICTLDETGISYDTIVAQLRKLTECSTPSLHARTKVRVMNNTCRAGAIIPKVDSAFNINGMQFMQVAASSTASETSYGQYPDKTDTSYEDAGGTFGLPFRVSLVHQAQENTDQELDWKIAFDYAMLLDKYVFGVERENDDGTTSVIYVHPQYWSSGNRTMHLRGPAFEEPLTPEEEIAVDRCRIGVDTSSTTFDICNCSLNEMEYPYPKTTMIVVNRGLTPFRIVDIRADESVLAKDTSSSVLVFKQNEYDSCRIQEPLNVLLNYTDEYTFEVCLNYARLHAQPIDENGYMLMENNLPVFITVPIRVVYQTDGAEFSQQAFIQVRVRAETYQMRYECGVKRGETIKGKFVKWEDVDVDVEIHPAIAELPENVVAGPANEGDFRMHVKTDLFSNYDENKITTEYLQAFRMNLCFDYLGEAPDCHKLSDDYGWGYVRSAIIPDKLKDVLQVTYPERNRDSERSVSIVFIPGAHSLDGYSSILGKHTFQFEIVRYARYTCETRAGTTNTINLTVVVEFTDPSALSD